MPVKKRPSNKPLKILYACSELAPLVTSGGLGDVASALPRALHAQGHDVRIAIPCYRSIPQEHRGDQYGLCVAELGPKTQWGALRISTVPGSDIPLYLIEHEGYFGREHPYGHGAYEYEDNAERYCFFCLALLHAIPQTHWRPDIVHCHDWHTAPIPGYIKTRLAHTDAWRGMPSLFTIHNLAYQGRYKARYLESTGFGWDLFTPDCLEFYGDINLMKAGIAFATKINTVSPRYAQEILTPEFGEGLDGFLRTRQNSLHGILNGVDYTQWDPASDPHIAARYSAADLTGKAVCKRALQNELGLPPHNAPLFGMVSRLYWQKGLDLMVNAAASMLQEDVQIVILGTGDPYYVEPLRRIEAAHPSRMRVLVKFDNALSHRIEAGSDFFLMPSHYEPCGLSQLYSLRYGTIPIVRETGGLADSVVPLSPSNIENGKATGIVFQPKTPEALLQAFHQAIHLYSQPDVLNAVRLTGMKQDFSWERSSKAYVELYRHAIARP